MRAWTLLLAGALATLVILLVSRHARGQLDQHRLTARDDQLDGLLRALEEIARPEPPSEQLHAALQRIRAAAPPPLLLVASADGRLLGSAPRRDRLPALPELTLARDRPGQRVGLTRGEPDQPVRARAKLVLDESGQAILLVAAALPAEPTLAEQGLARSMTVVMLVGLGCCALIGWLVLRERSGPLREMSELAGRMAAGEAPPVRYTTTPGEVGALARGLSEVAGTLGDQLDAVDAERRQLLAVFGAMVEGVIAVDAERRVLQLNSAAAALLDAPPGSQSSAIGRPIWELTRVPAIIDTLDHPGGPPQEVQITTPSRERRMMIHSAPLRDARGAPVGAVMVLHDITTLRRLEDVRRDFVANVSHELKTPVAVISSSVETMLDDPEMPPEIRTRFTTKVRDQAQRLSMLIDDLLTLSRLETVSQTADHHVPRVLDLREVAQASLDDLRGSFGAKGLTLRATLASEPLELLGDAESLRRLVDNLLTNAMRYTPEGGEVELVLERHDEQAELTVRDTGIGIDPRHQQRVFERFYRTDKARSRAAGGTGLGLAIVKHVTLSHGGNVSLDSAPDRGSRFRVTLPIRPASDLG